MFGGHNKVHAEQSSQRSVHSGGSTHQVPITAGTPASASRQASGGSPKRVQRAATVRAANMEESSVGAWKAPSVEAATENAQKLIFRHGTASLCGTSELEIGAHLGDGMQLYFVFMRYLATAMAAMSVLSVPALVLHYAGHGINEQEVDSMGLALFSLGNEGVNPANVAFGDCLDDGGWLDCNGTTVDLYGNTVLATDISAGLTAIDVTCLALFIWAMSKYHKTLDTVRLEVDGSTISVSDYTVYVEGLPHNATTEEILYHFDSRYNLSTMCRSYPLICGFMGRGSQRYPPAMVFELRHSQAVWRRYRQTKKRGVKVMEWAPHREVPETESGKRPIQHGPVTTDVAPNPACHGSWIADIHFGRPFGDQLRFFMGRKKQAVQKRQLQAQIRMYSPGTTAPKGPNPRKKAKLEKKLNKLRKNMKASAPHIDPRIINDCYGAFLVFNHVESARRCLDDYRSSGTFLGHTFQPTSLRFHRVTHSGQDHYWPLKITKAAAPTDVLWENLDTPKRSHKMRKFLTTLVTLALLVVSFLIANEAQKRQRDLESKTPTVAFCTSELAPIHWGSYYNNTPTDTTLVWTPDEGSCNTTADPDLVHISFLEGHDFDHLPVLRGPDLAPMQRSDVAADVNLCDGPCHNPDSDATCHTLACAVPEWQDAGINTKDCLAFRESFYVSCYCIQELERLTASDGMMGGAQRLLDEQGDVCSVYVNTFIEAKLLIIFAALVVLGVNSGLKIVLKVLTVFERHISTSKEARETVRKLTFALLLNTAIVAMLVNASMPNNIGSPASGTGIMEGDHSDFSRDWYTTVGVAITLTMILNVVGPHGGPIGKVVLGLLKRRLLGPRAASQYALNEIYTPPPFDISVRLPFVYVNMIVTLWFCGGIPLMLPIGCVSVTLAYWIDKIMLLRFYAKPPRYSYEMMYSALRFAPFAVVGHTAFTLWMFGNNDILKSDVIDMNLISPTEVDTSDEQAVQLAYDQFLDRVQDSDPFGREGIAAKVVRVNVFPLFLFLCWTILFWVLHKIMGNVIISFLRGMYKDFMFYCCGKRRIQDPDEAQAVSQVGFTDAYEQRVPKKLARGFHLTPAEVALGRRVAPLDNGELSVWQVWLEEGEAHGLYHDANSYKRTWEAILDNGLETYDIMANPKYYYAVTELFNTFQRQYGRDNSNENEEESSLQLKGLQMVDLDEDTEKSFQAKMKENEKQWRKGSAVMHQAEALAHEVAPPDSDSD